MNKLLFVIAGILMLNLSVCQAESRPKAVSDLLSVQPTQVIRIEMDKGKLSIVPAEAGLIRYQVEFVANKRSMWFWPFGQKGPSQEDYKASWASFDPETSTLRINTGSNINAIVKIGVAAPQPLVAKVSSGTVAIGQLTGKIKVAVGTGTIKYDASALRQGACVEATVNTGSVENPRDCWPDPADIGFHAGTGVI